MAGRETFNCTAEWPFVKGAERGETQTTTKYAVAAVNVVEIADFRLPASSLQATWEKGPAQPPDELYNPITVSGTVVAVSSLTERVYNPAALGVKRYQMLRVAPPTTHDGGAGSLLVVALETSGVIAE